MSRRAIELLQLFERKEGTVLKFNQASSSQMFQRAVKSAEIQNLTFHDSRHEAITRLANKLHVLDLARVVGHSDTKMLMIYYNPTMQDLADKLD